MTASKKYPDIPYRLITSGEELEFAVRSLSPSPILGIDCETTGLDPHIHKIRLIQLAAPGQPVALIDLYQIVECDRHLLRQLLANSALKVTHNGKFDWQFLTQAKLQPAGSFFDTQLAYRVLTAGLKVGLSLQAIAHKLLNVRLDKTQQVSDWSKPLTPQQLQYAALDAAVLLELYSILKEELERSRLLKIAQLEFCCMPLVAHMELNGMLLDLSRWQMLEVQLERDRDAALHQIRQFPVIQALLNYRRLSKITATFADSLPGHIHPVTGRIHPTYYQLGARSGRFSCRNPPLQTIPRDAEIRACFVAAPNYRIVRADYSQIELRIVARLSGDERMQQAYRKGEDLHRLTASLLTAKPIGSVSEEDRQLAKAINFGLIYGMGAAKLQSYAETKYGITLSLEEAKVFRKRFFEVCTGVADWHETIKRRYLQGVKESHTLAGRRRRWSCNPRLAELLNHPVQGLNADITKLALVKLSQMLTNKGTKLICTVHDEILLECPSAEVEQTISLLRRSMVRAACRFLHPVPVVVDVKASNSWGGAPI
jgi:DNA polymerase-1